MVKPNDSMVSGRELSPEMDRLHHRFNSDDWDDIYVIGDVHGCREALGRLLDTLEPSADDLVVFVGDLIRKGPDSKGVVDLVQARSNVYSVRGNNEQKVIDGRASVDSLTASDRAYLESLPAVLSWDDVVVVHGGIDHRKPLAEHTLSDLLNTRSLAASGGYQRPYWFETRREAPRVFFGHTVLAEPFDSEYAVGLDTGCVYGGQLTAYDYRAGELRGVNPSETHVSRSADSIVQPRPATSETYHEL